MADFLCCPEFPQYLNAVGEPGTPFGRRDAARFVFQRELAADSDTEDKTAFGEEIQRGHLLCHRRDVA